MEKLEKKVYLTICRKIGVLSKKIESAIDKKKSPEFINSLFHEALQEIEKLPLDERKKRVEKLPI